MLKEKDRSFKDGLEHATPSPETTRRLDSLEKDIEKVITSNSILSKISVGALIAIGIWVGTIQTRQLRSMDDLQGLNSRVDVVVDRIRQNDISSAEIKTKLINIEVTLQEIKLKLDNK